MNPNKMGSLHISNNEKSQSKPSLVRFSIDDIDLYFNANDFVLEKEFSTIKKEQS